MNEVNEILKKKKWYKRKWPYIVLVLVLLIGGIAFAQYKKSSAPPAYETVKVLKGTIKQTVDATGNIESANDLNLSLEVAGRVNRIYKNVNDSVRAGEVILDLDLSQLNAVVAGAGAAVAQAQANLDKQLAGNTSEYVAQLQAALDKTKADLNQAQGTEPGVEKSKIVQNVYDDTVAILQGVQNILSSSLTAADNILGVDNTLVNQGFKDSLSRLNPGNLNMANMKYVAAKSSKIDFDNAVNILNKNSAHQAIDYAASQGEEALLNIKDLLFYTAAVLDSTISSSILPQNSLDVFKTDIQTARVNVVAKYSSLTSQEHAIETARSSFYSLQALVDRAQAALNDAKNPPREVDIASYRAAVQSAEASLAQAVANRNKARLFAPANGVLGKIVPKVGEYVAPQNVIAQLVSPHFEVKVDIPETDIIKINVGDQANIKLDAYGDEVKFVGKVTQIEKGQTVIQDVVYYKVTVSLENDGQHQILSGMTANIIFATEQKDGALYIPQRAVHANGEKYVNVLMNGVSQKINVKTGLKGDGGVVEITEGLQEGQDVILGTK